MTTCTRPNCDKRGDRPENPHGLCLMHYARLQRGSPPMDAPPKATRDPLARWWECVDTSGGMDACWPWTGRFFLRGHGLFSAGSRTDKSLRNHGAHRWGYERIVGPVPEGLTLDHTCHRPASCRGGTTCPHRRCVNPRHLEPVTMAENNRRGASNKLSDAQVLEIRARYDGKRGALGRLAPDYGVHADTIGLVVRRRTHTHV